MRLVEHRGAGGPLRNGRRLVALGAQRSQRTLAGYTGGLRQVELQRQSRMAIVYLAGDATPPAGRGNKIIAHVCNDQGKWGKGFVMAISARWPQPEAAYRSWFAEQEGFELGAVRFIQVEGQVWVANMIGQQGIQEKDGVAPIRYAAVWSGLQAVAEKAKELMASVHMPRIGCGLAGGEWTKIEPIIRETLCKLEIAVTVYDRG